MESHKENLEKGAAEESNPEPDDASLSTAGDDAWIDFCSADLRHADFTRARLTTVGDGSNIDFSEAYMDSITLTGWSPSAGHPNANVIIM